MAETLVKFESLAAAHRRIATLLDAAGIGTAALDARLLIQHAAGLTHEEFVARGDEALPPGAAPRLEALVARRRAREPVARILGHKEFWGREFLLTPETLVPRPDSEVLVEAGLAAIRDCANPVIADLGTGTGCLLVTLLAERTDAHGLGIDCCERALACARTNAARHGVADRAAFAAGDWLAGVELAFDLIVANPPYIPTGEIGGLAPEVSRFDPRAALDGDMDGLGPLRAMAAGAARCLKPGGVVLVEVGRGQSGEAVSILAGAGLEAAPDRAEIADLAGIPRAIKAVNRH